MSGSRAVEIGLVGIVVLSLVYTCVWSGDDTYQVNVQPERALAGAGSGLDLRAVGAAVETSRTAEELERALNDPARLLNNLDLDQDGQVDYIRVREFGEGDSRGFILTAELEGGQSLEVATIDVEKLSESEGQMEIAGDPNLYGQNRYYHSGFSFTDVLIMSWLFSGRPAYSSPWGYGSYPPSYRRYSTVPMENYRARTATAARQTRVAPASRSQLSTRHQQSVASSKASLRRPLTSQRSFRVRSRSGRGGGFGSARPSARSSGSRFGRGGGFGGGGK